MTPHFIRENWNGLNIDLLQLFSKSELRDGIKTFLEPKYFYIFNQI